MASTLKYLASDPSNGVVAFARAHWAPTINKMLVFLVPGRQDNSVRGFDPVTNTWEYLLQAGTAGALPARDNFASLLNPKLNQLYVWGGSYIDDTPHALRSGVFDYVQRKWISVSETDGGSFASIIKNFGGFAIDAGCAWSAGLNIGVIFGGSIQGNPSNLCWIIEPNPGQPEPYIMSPFAGICPPARDQAHNLLAATPDGFYLLSGHSGNDDKGNWLSTGDFWRFRNRTWERLPDPPASAYQACLTYDSDLNLLIAWVGGKLLAFSPTTNAWSDVTPSGLPNLGNQLGAYCPSAKMHCYLGGNDWANDGAGFRSTVGVSISNGGHIVSSWVPDIPLRTWIAKPLPTIPNSPGGKSASQGSSKHLRWATCTANGLTYEMGGDYSTQTGNSWYGLWSVDVIANVWNQEYPFDGFAGEICLGARDEVGFVWDSKRKVFWILPGFIYNTPAFRPALGTEVYGTILTFDPVTRKFANPGAAGEPIGGQKPKNGIYDPVTDSIYRAGAGNTGNCFTIFHIGTNNWDYVETSYTADGVRINDTEFSFEYLAADIKGRKIYAIDPIDYRLCEFGMDTHQIVIKASIPEPNPARIALSRQRTWTLKDFCMPIFDSINRVLLYPYINALDDARPILLIYHPDTDKWEQDPMKQPEGIAIRGNSFWFDEVHNLFCSFGGMSPGGDNDPTFTHWFQYRYGNGDGNVETAPVIGVNPASLTVQVGQTATFNVAATGTNLKCQWQRNGVDIPAATSQSFSLATKQADDGSKFRAFVSNSAGGIYSQEATLKVLPVPPGADITIHVNTPGVTVEIK